MLFPQSRFREWHAGAVAGERGIGGAAAARAALPGGERPRRGPLAAGRAAPRSVLHLTRIRSTNICIITIMLELFNVLAILSCAVSSSWQVTVEASAPWAGGPAALRCAVHATDGDAPPARIERWYRDDAPLHLPSPAPGA